ncbi:MAG: DUF4234 domain-containing protein, partial [Actinomycetota bacterium]|nr:DUF4234 domain-containing protein [Actinomycetota bacterium]
MPFVLRGAAEPRHMVSGALAKPEVGLNVSRNTGPLGRERGVVFVILISIITLGIYYLYWVFKSHE